MATPFASKGAPPPTAASGTTCWQKRAYYQNRNPGLKETLGSGTRYSSPCVLDAYLAIEQAAAEFDIEALTDTMIRIAAVNDHEIVRWYDRDKLSTGSASVVQRSLVDFRISIGRPGGLRPPEIAVSPTVNARCRLRCGALGDPRVRDQPLPVPDCP